MKIEQNVYVYHYYEDELGPFRNLSSLTVAEASLIMNRIKVEGRVFASQRSDDYMTIRRMLEAKAREMFIQKGGKPINVYPHYMTLGECNWIKDWFERGKELSMNIEEFDPEQISFTYGDLFPTMRFMDGKPYRGNLYTKQEIFELIKQYGLPQVWNKDGELGPERYIEVQIWNDIVVE